VSDREIYEDEFIHARSVFRLGLGLVIGGFILAMLAQGPEIFYIYNSQPAAWEVTDLYIVRGFAIAIFLIGVVMIIVGRLMIRRTRERVGWTKEMARLTPADIEAGATFNMPGSKATAVTPAASIDALGADPYTPPHSIRKERRSALHSLKKLALRTRPYQGS